MTLELDFGEVLGWWVFEGVGGERGMSRVWVMDIGETCRDSFTGRGVLVKITKILSDLVTDSIKVKKLPRYLVKCNLYFIKMAKVTGKNSNDSLSFLQITW